MSIRKRYGWYTDRTQDKFCIIGEEPEGYTRGRTPGRTYMTPRKIARNLKFRKYIGKECPEGHILRYVSTGQCVECMTS